MAVPLDEAVGQLVHDGDTVALEGSMTTEDAPQRGAHFVQSLERGLTVIRAFSAQRPSMTLSEIGRASCRERV